jgi:hypothetical protein
MKFKECFPRPTKKGHGESTIPVANLANRTPFSRRVESNSAVQTKRQPQAEVLPWPPMIANDRKQTTITLSTPTKRAGALQNANICYKTSDAIVRHLDTPPFSTAQDAGKR